MRVRLTGLAAVVIAIVVAILSSAGAANAAAPVNCPHAAFPPASAVTVVGQLSDTRTDPCTPVAGVHVTVEDLDGNLLGEATSGDDGTFTIPLPDVNYASIPHPTILVKIDESTLPKDSVLTHSTQVSNKKVVKVGGNQFFVFPIGPDLNPHKAWYDNVSQNLVDGFKFSLLLALAALGLSMIFGTTGLTNFAHGELITFGALVAFFFNSNVGLPVILAGILAVVVSGGFGWAQDAFLWKPLRRRGTGLIAMMIVSIGLSIFLRSIYQYTAGADAHLYTQFATVSPYEIGPVLITPRDILVSLVAIIVLVGVTVALQKTRIGKATRAVADNPALAASSGINVDQVISVVWIGGAALAGLSGFLLGMTQGFDFQLGFKILLLVFAAVTLGGLGTIWGALLGSLVVGVFIEVSTLIIPAELKFAGALAVLIIVLLIRPQGLLGRAERVG